MKEKINLPLIILLTCNVIWLDLFAGGIADDIYPSYDSVFFLSMANNILNLGELGWQGYFEPFLYSLITALFSFVSSEMLHAGILVSKVSKLLLLIATYYLGRDLFGKKVGLVAVVLVSFMPHIKAIADSPQSESLYAFFITLSIWLLWRSYKLQSLALGVATGLFFTAAYLTRSEGIFILCLLLGGLFFHEIIKKSFTFKKVLVLATVLIIFLMSSFPYFLYLKNHYGVWTLGTKTASVYFWARARSFKDPDPNRVEWGLNAEGELNIISLTSKEYIDYWMKDPAKSIKVYFSNLKAEIPGFIPNTSSLRHYPQVYPLYFVFPMILGLIIRARRKSVMLADGYLLTVFIMFLIYPFFTSGWWRYLVTYSPVFMILTANGLKEISEYLKSRSNTKAMEKRVNIIFLVVLMTISTYHIWVVVGGKLPPDMKRYVDRKDELAMESKKAGLWAQKNLPPKLNYMISWSRLVYYLDGKWIAMPETGFKNMLWYAKKNNVDYIVYEGLNRQQVINMERSMSRVPDLEVATVYKSSTLDYNVVFIKLLK